MEKHFAYGIATTLSWHCHGNAMAITRPCHNLIRMLMLLVDSWELAGGTETQNRTRSALAGAGVFFWLFRLLSGAMLIPKRLKLRRPDLDTWKGLVSCLLLIHFKRHQLLPSS